MPNNYTHKVLTLHGWFPEQIFCKLLQLSEDAMRRMTSEVANRWGNIIKILACNTIQAFALSVIYELNDPISWR